MPVTDHRRPASRVAWPLAAALLAAGLAGIVVQSTDVRRPGLLVVLVVLELLVYLADLAPLPGWQLDAGLGVSLVALVFCGPLAAFVVIASPEPFRRIVQRGTHRPRPIALAVNTASFACGPAVAYALLRAAPHPGGTVAAWPVYAAAATVMVLCNVVIVWGVLYRVVDRRPWLPGLRLAVSMLPLAFLAALVACLFHVVGLPALALFAAIACLPGVLVRCATPVLAPRAAALEPTQAMQRYAGAIADALELSRAERRAIRIACGDAPAGPVGTAARMFGDQYRGGQITFELGVAERHDDAGEWMSVATCVLEVARAWASLTARGTLELSHTAALACVEAERWHFSARVLRAAWQVVDDQPAAARERAWAPAARPLGRRITALGAAVL